MAKINGQIVTCDRCGAQVFRKCTGEGEADGGFTRWNKFEPLPDGWDLVAIPKRDGAPSGNVYNSYIQVCPKCQELWDGIINDYFLQFTKFYTKEQSDGKQEADA